MLKVEAEALELVVGVLSISSMISCEAGFLESNWGLKVACFRSKGLSKPLGKSNLMIFANLCNDRSYRMADGKG